MNYIKKLALITAAAMLSGAGAFGQPKSAYFLDNYSFNYRLNPAFMPERGFLSVGVGNIEMSLGSNLGLSSLLYPSADGKSLVTGLNQSVSSETFLSGLNDVNNIFSDAFVNMLSIGSRKENKFTNIEINVRSLADVSLSSDLFKLLKTGSAGQTYDLSSTSASVDEFIELAIGRSHYREDKKWGLGYRLKFLLGVGSAQLFFDDTQVKSDGNQLFVNLNGRARLACPYFNVVTDKDGKITDFEEVEDPEKSVSGYGGALDFGFFWKPVDGLNLSLGITDFGFINWEYSQLAQSKGYVKFNGLDLSDENAKAEDELNDLGKQFEELANLSVKNGSETALRMLPYKISAGAKYRFPFANFASIGAHTSYQNAVVPYWDTRFGATLSPFGWFSLSGNFGYNSVYGDVCGVAASLTLLCLNVFLAVDGYRGPVGQNVQEDTIYPVNKFNYRVNCGLVLQFGKRFPRR